MTEGGGGPFVSARKGWVEVCMLMGLGVWGWKQKLILACYANPADDGLFLRHVGKTGAPFLLIQMPGTVVVYESMNI